MRAMPEGEVNSPPDALAPKLRPQKNEILVNAR